MRLSFWRLAIAVCALLAAAVAPAFAVLRPSVLPVVAGESIGYAKLGATKQATFVSFGMPDDIERERGNEYWVYFLGSESSEETLVISWTNPAPGVDFINTNASVADARGVKPKVSTLADVVARFGFPKSIATVGYRRLRVDYPALGIRFLLDQENNVVQSITVVPK